MRCKFSSSYLLFQFRFTSVETKPHQIDSRTEVKIIVRRCTDAKSGDLAPNNVK